MDVDITLSFFGRTEEAVSFYCESIGAECIHLTRFRDSLDELKTDPELADKIFHATFVVGSTRIMASDVGCSSDQSDQSQVAFAGSRWRYAPTTLNKLNSFSHCYLQAGACRCR